MAATAAAATAAAAAAAATATIEYIGASWCAPCKTVKPHVITLAHKFAISLIQKDYDEMEEDEKNNVKKLPTIRVYLDDTIDKEITTNHVDSLEIWLRNHVRVNGDEDF